MSWTSMQATDVPAARGGSQAAIAGGPAGAWRRGRAAVHRHVTCARVLVAPLVASLAISARGECKLEEHGVGQRGTVPVRGETVASGLEVPWAIGFLPNGDWLVTERPGRVRRVHAGRLEPEPVAKVPTSSRAEGGLLGLAVDPDFARTRAFFLYYTARAPAGDANRVARWVLAPDGRSAHEEKVLLQNIPAARFHDGGRIRFGPDGYLYVGTGDATEPERALDPGSPSGKLLRIDRDGGVPNDNPVPGKPAFVLGIRNLQAFDWLDPRTIIMAEHGPSGEMGRTGHDRVSLVRGGDNLGWPTVYGCETRKGFVEPLLSWRQAVPPGGGAIYRGDRIPEWKGSFIVGTLGSRALLRVALGRDRSLASYETYFEGDPPRGFGRLREVIVAPDGELYVTTSNCDGRGTCGRDKDLILRIVH